MCKEKEEKLFEEEDLEKSNLMLEQWKNRKRRLIVDESGTEVVLYFYKPDNAPDKRRLEEALTRLNWNGHCSGWDLERLVCGEIKIYFNPICHGFDDRSMTIESIAEVIRAAAR